MSSLRSKTLAEAKADLLLLEKKRDAAVASLAKKKAIYTLQSSTKSKAAEFQHTSALPAEVTTILLDHTQRLNNEVESWEQESLYRMAGITTFGVQEPGPDGGKVIGIRIEVFVDGRFLTPHYLFLTPHPIFTPSKDEEESHLSKTHLKLHKHTLPTYHLPLLNSLLAKYLPPPPTPQNLAPVLHALRAALLYHAHRKFHLENVQSQLMPDGKKQHKILQSWIVDEECLTLEVEWPAVTVADPEAEEGELAKKVRKATVVFTADGEVEKVVVLGNRKRVRGMEGKIMNGAEVARGERKKESFEAYGGILALKETLLWRDE